MIADAERHAKQVLLAAATLPLLHHPHSLPQTSDVARGMGALKSELAAAKRTEGSGGTPGRTAEMMSMQRQILDKIPGMGGGGEGGAEVASMRQQLEQSRSDAQDARSLVQQLRQQVCVTRRALQRWLNPMLQGTLSQIPLATPPP